MSIDKCNKGKTRLYSVMGLCYFRPEAEGGGGGVSGKLL